MFAVVKGRLFADERPDPVEVAGSLYRFIEREEPIEIRGEVFEGQQVFGYRGTLVAGGWRMAGFADYRLETDNGFAGRVRVRRLDVSDDGRAFVLHWSSVGKPDNQPAE